MEQMRLRRLCAVLILVPLASPALGAEPVGIDLRFDRLNGSYENLVAEVEPIVSGPLTVHLSSPEHQLELTSNRLELERLEDGRHTARVSVRFTGSGSLNTELDFGGIPASLEDRVVFPEQEVTVDGKVSIERSADGYLVTVEELPGFVTVEMHSRLGAELVAWCSRLALFVAGDAGCADLERQLTHPRLPLPAPGFRQLVRSEELTAEERDQIDLYLFEPAR